MGRLAVVAVCLAGSIGCGFSGPGGGTADAPRNSADGTPRSDGPPGVADAGIDGPGPPDADPCATPFQRSLHGCHAFGAVARTDWVQAQAACQALGGDLPIINTSAESTYVAGAIPTGVDDRVWLGLSGAGTDGSQWTWIDGQTVAQKGLDLWDSGEPGSADRCGVVRPDSDWAGRGCTSITFIVVCERFL